MGTIREQSDGVMPLYTAGFSDLGPSDLVVVECVCGNTERLSAGMLATAGADADDKIADLAPRLRGRECDGRGKVVVSIRWAG
jgi:hypothetical protein